MDKMSFPFVSVIIPVYNDPFRLQKCLQALEEQTYPKSLYEVIVIDNGSDESITPVVAPFRQVKTGYETQRGSYAARNKGISVAQGEVVAFTDSDCIPASDWIEKGVLKLLRTPNCGIVGGKVELFCKDPDHPTAAELYEMFIGKPLDQKERVEKELFAVTANLFTFKKVFEQVGYFDKKLESGGDKKWGRQVVSCRYELIYAADVHVAHPARHSFAQVIARVRRYGRGFVDKKWEENLPPSTWNYKTARAFLPPLPPVITIMRLKKATFKTKMMVIVLWCIVQYIKITRRWRRILRRNSGK